MKRKTYQVVEKFHIRGTDKFVNLIEVSKLDVRGSETMKNIHVMQSER